MGRTIAHWKTPVRVPTYTARSVVTAMMPHSGKNALRVFNCFVNEGGNVNENCYSGSVLNALNERLSMVAIKYSHEGIFKLLVQLGANLYHMDNVGNSLLHIASSFNSPNIASFLIELRADVNSRNNKGRTPCYDAASNGHNSIVRLLVGARASFGADNNGTTPVYAAARQGHYKAIATLEEAGALINEPKDAELPIGIAARYNHFEAVHLLAHLGSRFVFNGRGFWQSSDISERPRWSTLYGSIIYLGGDLHVLGSITASSLAKRVEILKAFDFFDPRVRVIGTREKLRKDYFVLSLLLDQERATAADGDVMGKLRVLPEELVREVITHF